MKFSSLTNLKNPFFKERINTRYSLGSKKVSASFWLSAGLAIASTVLLYYESNKDLRKTHLEQKLKECRHKWDNNLEVFFEKAEYDTSAANPKQSRKQVRQLLLSQVEEIKTIVNKTHCVLVHGQSTALTPLIYFYNHLAKKRGIAASSLFNYIRLPQNFDEEDLLKRIQLAKLGKDYKDSVREILLSVNHTQSRQAGESAHYFFKRNRSMINCHTPAKNKVSIQELTKKALAHDELSSHSEKIGGELEKIAESLEPISLCGNMIIIIIPRALVPQLIYRCHCFGKACRCFANNQPNLNRKCHKPQRLDAQYRLTIPLLAYENQIYCLLLSPFTKAQRKEIKNRVEKIVEVEATHSFSLNN